jgi:UDP-glucose 4-epimerase
MTEAIVKDRASLPSPAQQLSELSRQRVLITGATGFLGSNLCRALLPHGADVHATSRQAQPSAGKGPTWWQTELADIDATRQLLAAIRPDVIFHLSGAVGASPELARVVPTYQSLLTATVNMLVAATEIGCRRLILTGSLTEPIAGGGEATPRSPYAAAKWAGSAYARMCQATYGTPAVIVRPFMTYGPGQHGSKLIPSVILALARGEAPRLASGRTRADWVYVADVIDGLVAAATLPGIEGETFDLGSGRLVSIRAIVERLGAMIDPGIPPLFGALADRAGENEAIANTAATLARLGWQATTPLEMGLAQTVSWFRERASRGGAEGPRAPRA